MACPSAWELVNGKACRRGAACARIQGKAAPSGFPALTLAPASSGRPLAKTERARRFTPDTVTRVAPSRPKHYLAAMARHPNAPASGPSQRQLRVGELIRRTLSEVLSRGEIHDPELNAIPITVGEVVVSGNLKLATAYVLPLGGQGKAEMLAALRRNRHELRRAVTSGMALKFSPELRFEIDETFDRLDDTRRMFSDERVQRDLAAPTGEDDGEN